MDLEAAAAKLHLELEKALHLFQTENTEASNSFHDILLDHLLAALDWRSPLRPLKPVFERIRQGEQNINQRDIITAFFGLVLTDEDIMEEWVRLPQKIRDITLAFIHGKDIPGDDLPDGKPMSSEFSEAQSVLAERFRLQMLNLEDGDPNILEGNGSRMVFIKDLPFYNWGGNVQNVPRYTFVAKSVVGVQNLVKWCNKQNLKVRCAGYTHTWSNAYSQDGQILVTLLPLDVVRDYPSPEPPLNPNYIQFIEVVKETDTYGHIKIGAGTTNHQFRCWAFDHKTWTLPINVIMVEITFGGSNGPICHGAGIKTSTLSDLVVALEYVDSNGVLQTITDPVELKTASGCFGLLGIVTAVTLRVDKASTAVLQPYKPRIGLAIPPPEGYTVPSEVDMSGITPEQLQQAQKEFEANVYSTSYSEWFWFPYNSRSWVNCWAEVPDVPADIQTFPPRLEAFIDWIGAWFLRIVINTHAFKQLPGRIQGTFLGLLAMSQLPGGDTQNHLKPTYALKSDALQFQRGIQNYAAVNDVEWEIPIPKKADGTLDLSVVQRAWWDAISATYADPNGSLRTALEIRITGGSDVVLAPQRYNQATASIEILTLANMNQQEWKSYAQGVVDKWAELQDPGSGKLLLMRPHWAKMWEGYRIRGSSVEDYMMNTAYKNEIAEFRNGLSMIAQRTGSSLDECRARFGNPLYEKLFFSANA